MQRVLALAFVLALPANEMQAEDLTAALSPEELATVSDAVDRGLQWLSKQQNTNGSFNDIEGTPITGYAVLAFLSRGHQPGQGRYGRQVSRAIEFILSTQRPDGSFSALSRERLPYIYSHALSALTLSEAYASTGGAQAERIRQAIEAALAYSRRAQQQPKLYPSYRGGWGYGDYNGRSRAATPSVPTTAWELTFLRSASNAGFEVPQEWPTQGLEFVERCYRPGPRIESDRRLLVGAGQGVFLFYPERPPGQTIWANFNTTSAGILAFALHGRRGDSKVRKAADWIVGQPIPRQGTTPGFYYGCYLWSQAMAQVGGKHWESFFPRLARILMSHQAPDGQWRLDRDIGWGGEEKLGPQYYTAIAVICLTLPDQLLPIHQR